VTRQTLYQMCPLCDQGTVVRQNSETVYRCDRCGLTIKEQTLFNFFKKGRLSVESFGDGDYLLARQGLMSQALAADPLKVAIGNVYTDEQLAAIAAGSFDILRPVRTVLAEIILEQLNEACFIQVTELRRGHGQPLTEVSSYLPTGPVPRQDLVWQDKGNLFCTTHRFVFPSDRFTFIRLDRKLVGVKAFSNGVAVQRKGEDYATYFVDCFAHEAALIAAYVLAKVPSLAKSRQQSSAKTTEGK